MIESGAGNSILIPGQWNDAPDSGYGVNNRIFGVVEMVPVRALPLTMDSSSMQWSKVGMLLAAAAAVLLVLTMGGVLIGVILWRDKKARESQRR